MKKRNQFIRLLYIAVLLFAGATACDKTDDPGGDFPSAGTVKDADDNIYKTVKIGTQVWTVENLKTTKYNDGTPIPNVTDSEEWASLRTDAYSNYDNLASHAETFGRLYNWYAVNTGKLAPEGWHVPTDDDWTILENYLITNGYNYDGTKDLNKINKIAKSLSAKTNWALSSEVGTPGASPENNNSTGFTALPGGRRDREGKFDLIGNNGYWWSSTQSSSEANAYSRVMGYNAYPLGFLGTVKESGFSVRMVRD
jgi:uncharacterized protein (TIGR02145 family)